MIQCVHEKKICLLHFGDLTPKIIDILSVQASNSKEEYKINKQTNKQKTRKKQQIIKIKYLISINNKKCVSFDNKMFYNNI